MFGSVLLLVGWMRTGIPFSELLSELSLFNSKKLGAVLQIRSVLGYYY
jgi:hypothetical protein